MSLITKCDVCGRELEHMDVFYVFDEKMEYGNKKIKKGQVEICSRCFDMLAEIILEGAKDDIWGKERR